MLSLLGKLEPRELGGQTVLDTDMHTEAHQEGSGKGKKLASELWGNRTWGQCPGVVAGCPFEDPGTHSVWRASAHRIGKGRGVGKFGEFLPLTLPPELFLQLGLVMSSALQRQRARTSTLHSSQVWGVHRLGPLTSHLWRSFRFTSTAFYSATPTCFQDSPCHPGLSPALP